jgi:hypothetical protein
MLGAGLYHDLRRYLVFEYCASTLEALLDVAEKPPPTMMANTAGSQGGQSQRNSVWGGLNPFTTPARPQVCCGC